VIVTLLWYKILGTNQKRNRSMAKVGRPLIAERRMTDAERKQRSRTIRAEEGIIDMVIPVKIEQKTVLAQFAIATGKSKAEVLELMLDVGVAGVVRAFEDAVAKLISNASEVSVVRQLSEKLGREISIEEIKGFRDAMTEI